MKYTIPGISVIIACLLYASEQWISQTFDQEIQKIPWGWVLIVVFAFFVGIIYADLLNSESQLRRWIRKKRQIAEIENFVLAHEVENSTAWYKAIIHLRFLGRMKNINYSVEITQYVGHNAQNSFIIKREIIPSTDKNLFKKITVATYPQRLSKEMPVGYPYWGGDKNHTWAGDGNHIVTLTLNSKLRRQTHKFLISSIKDVGAGSEPVILFGAPKSQAYVNIR